MSQSVAQAADGELDTSWGGTGFVILTHTEVSSSNSVATDSNDRVITAGWLTDGPSSRIIVARFLTNGLIDTTCNGTGENIDLLHDAVASDVVVLDDDSFIITGTMQVNNKSTLFLAKFLPTCLRDSSFGTAGFATYTSAFGASGRALAIQADGRIVVVGDEFPTVSDSSDQRILVTRFTSSGNLDTAFGLSGRFLSSSNQAGQAQDLVIDSNGRIIFTGSIVGTIAPDAAIAGRLSSTGQLDATFATQGYFIDEFEGDPRLNAISMRPNGHFVAVGTYVGPYPSTQQSPLVVCLTDFGLLDTECGSSGWRSLSKTNYDVYGDDVVVTADNTILLSGMIDGVNTSPMVMRLKHSGEPDSSFGSGGTWLNVGLTGRMYALSIQDDGRILGAGYDEEIGLSSLTVIRLNNTITPRSTIVSTTTTTAPLVTTSTTIPTTTIAPEQLPATGSQFDSLTMALLLTALGSIVVAARRRTSH